MLYEEISRKSSVPVDEMLLYCQDRCINTEYQPHDLLKDAEFIRHPANIICDRTSRVSPRICALSPLDPVKPDIMIAIRPVLSGYRGGLSKVPFPADSTMAQFQEKLSRLYSIPVEKQLIVFQDKVLNRIYFPEDRFAELKEIKEITSGSFLILARASDSDYQPLHTGRELPEIKTPIPQLITTHVPGGFRSSSLNFHHLTPSAFRNPNPSSITDVRAHQFTPTASYGDQVLIRCTQQPYHDLDNPEDQISRAIARVSCKICGAEYQPNYALPSLLTRKSLVLVDLCQNCGSPDSRTMVLHCGKIPCSGEGFCEQSVLWSVFKSAVTQTSVVRFSGCSHIMRLRPLGSHIPSGPHDRDFETLLLTQLDRVLVRNYVFDSSLYGDYVFHCPFCLESVPQVYSYAAFNTCSVLSPWLKNHLRLVVSQKKTFIGPGFTGVIPSTAMIQRNTFERCCSQFINEPFRCPTCKYSIGVPDDTKTHASCIDPKCPKFCIICLKVETPGSDLLSHNKGFATDPFVCPVFLENHHQFGGEPLNARRTFMYWRAVCLIWDYADRMKALDIILSIKSLEPYTTSFDKLANLRRVCVLPKSPIHIL